MEKHEISGLDESKNRAEFRSDAARMQELRELSAFSASQRLDLSKKANLIGGTRPSIGKLNKDLNALNYKLAVLDNSPLMDDFLLRKKINASRDPETITAEEKIVDEHLNEETKHTEAEKVTTTQEINNLQEAYYTSLVAKYARYIDKDTGQIDGKKIYTVSFGGKAGVKAKLEKIKEAIGKTLKQESAVVRNDIENIIEEHIGSYGDDDYEFLNTFEGWTPPEEPENATDVSSSPLGLYAIYLEIYQDLPELIRASKHNKEEEASQMIDRHLHNLDLK